MLGDNIKRLMKANGYTQKELAIRSGCTESAISRYANDKSVPTLAVLKALAIALGVTVDELMACKECGRCIHYPVCEAFVSPRESFPEVDGCKCFKRKDLYQLLPDGRLELIPTSDNIKSKFAEDLLSEIKKEAHNKAVHSQSKDIQSYITLRDLDGIIQKYINKYYEEGKKNEKCF